MKSQIKREIEILLTLNEKEARMLRAMMQNPLNGQHPRDEPKEEFDIRVGVFETLKVALEGKERG